MTVLTALASLYERMAEKGEAPKRGYSTEKIGSEVVIDRAGNLVEINPKLVADGKRMVAAQMQVPLPPPDRRGTKIVSGFLWDPAPYALGASLSAEKEFSLEADRAREKHEVFKEFHRQMLDGLDDDGAQAFLAFLKQWRPEDLSSLPSIDDILKTNVVFRLDSDVGTDGQYRYLHERPELVSAWLKHLDEGSIGDEHICLVTGKCARIARLHPSFSGLGKEAQSSGAYLVSFNIGSKDVRGASSSFGKTQGENAPVSEAAAFAYGTALNALLARSEPGPGRRALRIGDTTTVFWAETPDRDSDEASEDLMAGLLDPPREDDTSGETIAEVEGKLHTTLEALARGQVPDDPRFHPETRVYVLGLAPNAARLSVRFWLPGTLGGFARNALRFRDDLRLDPPAWKRAPAPWALLYETALQHKAQNIPPLLGGELMRSVLGGLPYPRLLIAAVIGRIRADGVVNGPRAAICKAFLKRNINPEEDRMSLDRESDDIAYVLGRLFAAYAYAEQSFASRNATIRDRYLSGASANPAGVFPLLMKGYEHNRSRLLKSDGKKRGAGVNADKAVSEIMDRITASGGLPASLPMDEQARFFIGFYHQFNHFFEKLEAAAEAAAKLDDQEDG